MTPGNERAADRALSVTLTTDLPADLTTGLRISPSEPGPGVIRLAVISDAHVGGRGDATWHNQLRYDDAPSVLAAAVQAAKTHHAHMLVALGDLADRGDAPSLRDVRAALSMFPGPVRVVPGNHDRAQDNETFETAFSHADTDIKVADRDAEDHGGLGLCGVTVESSDGGVTCLGFAPETADWPGQLMVLASHYPVLDVSGQLAAAGVRDAGVLRNHDTAFAGLATRTTPTLVLNGHLHARVEHTVGSVLQLSVGALVESPHEITFVDIAIGPDIPAMDVTVHVQRLQLRRVANEATLPVLAPVASRWMWNGKQWNRRPPGPGGRPVLCLDWNGTVVDDDERARRVSVAVLSELGLDGDRLATVADFRREFTLPLAAFFRSQAVPDPDADRAVARWNELMLTSEPPELSPGARQLLTWAMRNDLNIHIVSGADPQVAATDLRVLLPDVRVSSVVGHAHPKSMVLEQLASSGTVVFVGDTTYDIAEGRRAGAIAIGFASDANKASRLAAAGADQVVTDLTQIQELISSRYLEQEPR